MKLRKKKYHLPPDGYLSDGSQHYYKIANGKIIHIVNSKKSPLINILYDINSDNLRNLYKIDAELFDIMLREAIINLGLLNEIRDININEILK
jgi:hypothetical protein